MELKVWVDGIKRVVCGVTDNTTCQDIVIALAQAMGRTGRFTLIEKWRENERPLSPRECPLLVLQKWGEFANEVKLMLYESGSRRKQKLSEKEEGQKPQDRFTHNFTPPTKPSDTVVKRSLTFSGGRKSESDPRQDLRLKSNQRFAPSRTSNVPMKSLQMTEKVMSDGNSWSSSSSISSQNSALPPSHNSAFPSSHNSAVPSSHNSALLPSQHRRVRSSSEDRRRPSPQLQQHSHPTSQQTQIPAKHYPSNSSHNSIPQNNISRNASPSNYHNQNHRQSSGYHQRPNSGGPIMNGPIVRTSAFSPVRPRRSSVEDDQDYTQVPNSDLPMYTQTVKKSSQKSELEEYDLDSNFPDVVKETGRGEFLIEEYHVPGRPGHHDRSTNHHGDYRSWEEEERVKLLRLVTMQNERVKMQDSQLDIIDTEIASREQKFEDLKLELSTVNDSLIELSRISATLEEESSNLDNGSLIGEMETEKQSEREIKNEITSLRVRLEKCENSVHQFQTKVKLCSDELEKEKESLKSDEKRRKEEEQKQQEELSELQKDLNDRSKETESKTKLSEQVEEDLKDMSECLTKRTEELMEVEKELQRENLKFFQDPRNSEPVTVKGTSGEAVIKVLEGSVSPHVKRSKAMNNAPPLSVLNVAKSKNGVWV